MRQNLNFFNGTELKGIPIDNFPSSAWTFIDGRGTEDEFSSSFLRNTVGFFNRCIALRTATIRSVPWIITDKNTGNVLWLSGTTPPPELTWTGNLKKIIGLVESSLLLTGEAYIYKDIAFNGKLKGIKYLSPLTMKANWDATNGLVDFTRTLGEGQSIKYPPQYIVYIWDQDPLSETKANIPLAKVAANAAGVLYNKDLFVRNFFSRGAVKATLLTVEGNPEDQEKERLKTWWNRLFSGVKKSWETAVVSASVKPIIVGEGIKELSNTTLTNEQREDIAVTFGIPFSLLLGNAANFATAKIDKRNYYDETILPELDVIEPVLNQELFNELGFQFKFDYSRLDIFQEDETQRANAFYRYTQSGMTLSVAAQVLGIDLPEDTTPQDLNKDNTL